MKTKSKTPSESEVLETLELGKDTKLAGLLVGWFKIRKQWLKNRDGTAISKAMGDAIREIDDYLVDDPNRKARLMNEMINQYS